mgnify:FL=1|tara:strand:+ start:2944 stop:3645 length:702 start_codon:yes stop_codon:yes gene_type:complete
MDLNKIFIPNLKLEEFNRIHPKKNFIVIDGLIGAGKSTFIKKYVKYCKSIGIRAHPIYEPVELWKDIGALERFYSDIPQNCYEFQTFTFITRIESVINEVIENSDAEVFILERSIFTDRYIFVELLKDLLGDTRLKMYESWWNMWSLIFNINIHTWVLLDTSINTSADRIKIRNRNGEKVELDYLTNLHKTHINFYDELQRTSQNVKIIPQSLMDKNFIENDDVIIEIANLII